MTKNFRIARGLTDKIRYDVGQPYKLFDRGIEIRDISGEYVTGGGISRMWKTCKKCGSKFGLFCGRIGEDFRRPSQERGGRFVALRSDFDVFSRGS